MNLFKTLVIAIIPALILSIGLIGCGSNDSGVATNPKSPEPIVDPEPPEDDTPDPTILEKHQHDGLFGQGIAEIQGNIYFISAGDSQVLELDLDTMEIVWEGTFTVMDEVILQHPTGLAWADGYPVIIGGYKEFIVIDWEVFRTLGTLGHAIIKRIPDPYATGYVRAVYAERDGKILLISGGYCRGNWDISENHIRFYDANALLDSDSTDDPGVLIEEWLDMPQFIQSYVWLNGSLILVGNTQYAYGWKIIYVDPLIGTITLETIYDQPSELEGYYIWDGYEIFITGDGFFYTKDSP